MLAHDFKVLDFIAQGPKPSLFFPQSALNSMTIDLKKTLKNVSLHVSTFLFNKTFAFILFGFIAHGIEDILPVAVLFL